MLLHGDAFNLPIEAKSVHCVTTSPPYWGLRKYAGEQGEEPLGLEPTPEHHIERTVQWAREIWRVLRDDGVFWLNYGGRYASGNLMLLPHRIALALQADGWIVRQDLVWAKPNPMPESVAGWRWERSRTRVGDDPRREHAPTHNQHAQRQHGGPDKFAQPDYEYGDELELRRGSWRHTRSHEYVFMLVKGMQYWSDQEAVREAHAKKSFTVNTTPHKGSGIESKGERFNAWLEQAGRGRQLNPGGRNPRSVLNVATSPYKGAHYATFPPALIAPLITATCPRWACLVCGRGWAPVVKKAERIQAFGYRPTCDHPHAQAEAVPGIVLDPFIGSGTVGQVANFLGRRWIGLDISRPYLVDQASVRVDQKFTGKTLERMQALVEGLM